MRPNLDDAKGRIRRWANGEWLSVIYPFTKTHADAVALWRADLKALAAVPWCPACDCEPFVYNGNCRGCGATLEYR